MKAQPGPMVSGSHFFPKAPLLWVKWMPAWAVMSRKVMRSCARLAVTNTKGNTHHRDTEAQRNAGKKFFLNVCVTFGPRESRWYGLMPSCARLGRAGRPSPHESWCCVPPGGWRVRCSKSAVGRIRARGYSVVHCCLRDSADDKGR